MSEVYPLDALRPFGTLQASVVRSQKKILFVLFFGLL